MRQHKATFILLATLNLVFCHFNVPVGYRLFHKNAPQQVQSVKIPYAVVKFPSIYRPALLAKSVEQHIPICSLNTTSNFCLEDPTYPEYEIKVAIQSNYHNFMTLYADLPEHLKNVSVDGASGIQHEKFLCSSTFEYRKLLRARNLYGQWRIIVNVKHYYQHVPLETCTQPDSACPMIPQCYVTACHQKFIQHRLVTYDPWNAFQPFRLDIFNLPGSCACTIK